MIEYIYILCISMIEYIFIFEQQSELNMLLFCITTQLGEFIYAFPLEYCSDGCYCWGTINIYIYGY